MFHHFIQADTKIQKFANTKNILTVILSCYRIFVDVTNYWLELCTWLCLSNWKDVQSNLLLRCCLITPSFCKLLLFPLTEKKWLCWKLSNGSVDEWESPINVRIVRVRGICSKKSRLNAGWLIQPCVINSVYLVELTSNIWYETGRGSSCEPWTFATTSATSYNNTINISIIPILRMS